MEKYILVDGKPVLELDLMKWDQWLQNNNRNIVTDRKGKVVVSTVFLGLNHNYGEGEPLLFETMVFGLDEEEYGEIQERYSTLEEAEAGHKKMVEKYLYKGKCRFCGYDHSRFSLVCCNCIHNKWYLYPLRFFC